MVSEPPRIRALIEALRADPRDEASASVLADWAEEKGFADVADRLRRDGRDVGFARVLAALGTLLGFETEWDGSWSTERYTGVFPFEVVDVDPGVVNHLTVQPHSLFRFRKIAIASNVADYVSVLDVRVGKRQLLGSGQVPGELFRVESPEVFAPEAVTPAHLITLAFTNDSAVVLRVRACAMGDLVDEVDTYRSWVELPSQILQQVPEVHELPEVSCTWCGATYAVDRLSGLCFVSEDCQARRAMRAAKEIR